MMRNDRSGRVSFGMLAGLALLAVPLLALQMLSSLDTAPQSFADAALELEARPLDNQEKNKSQNTLSAAATKKPATKERTESKVEPYREEHGRLTQRDETLVDGEFFDDYHFEAEKGEVISIALRSHDFDTYLLLYSCDDDDFEIQNDDYRGLSSRSQIEFVVPETGEYIIRVSTYEAEEMGRYSLTFSKPDLRIEEGELAEQDEALETGEYIDWYEIEGELGEMGIFELNASSFDTYLILEDPEGETIVNDDHGSIEESLIESDFLLEGTYRIGVTSFEAGETGEYVLRIRTQEGLTYEDVAESDALERNLSGEEVTLDDGSFADGFSFLAEKGNTVIVSMKSEEFDSYLKIRGPGGMHEVNDDAEGETNSRIAFRVRESGRYHITATSYRPGDEGEYTIDFQLEATKYDAGDWAVSREGKVYGVFVGISEYPGDDNLPYCDADARRISNMMKRIYRMRNEDTVLLMNEDATYTNVTEAVERIALQAGPDDMFVFFYSGHGNQHQRRRADEFDPDGIDETLALYDDEITDDAFADLLEESEAGTCLVVIDSCFSGGFARDIVSKPGRIGIFSSEGDCLSLVAEKEEAGGYLSLFFSKAFKKDRSKADINNDQMITVHELTFYLQMQFHDVVHSDQHSRMSMLYPEGPIDPGENLGFQRIISDRNGVSPHLILYSW